MNDASSSSDSEKTKEKALSRFVEELRQQVTDALDKSAFHRGESNLAFQVQDIELVVQFEAEWTQRAEAGTGGPFFNLLPVTIRGGGERSRGQTHMIRLNLKLVEDEDQKPIGDTHEVRVLSELDQIEQKAREGNRNGSETGRRRIERAFLKDPLLVLVKSDAWETAPGEYFAKCTFKESALGKKETGSSPELMVDIPDTLSQHDDLGEGSVTKGKQGGSQSS